MLASLRLSLYRRAEQQGEALVPLRVRQVSGANAPRVARAWFGARFQQQLHAGLGSRRGSRVQRLRARKEGQRTTRAD